MRINHHTAHRLPNGFWHVRDLRSGLTATVNADGSIRHGGLRVLPHQLVEAIQGS